MRRSRALGVLGGAAAVGVLLALLAVTVIHGIHHTNKVTDQRDTAIAALRADLARVNRRLVVFSDELAQIATQKHARPRQIRRLQHQIERLTTATAPSPQPTATVTRRPGPRPTTTVTRIRRPACHGVKVNGGCVPTHLPTPLPSLRLGG